MHDHEKQIPIWFFIGALLTLYGLIIFASGIYGWINPPPPETRVKLWSYHSDVWWSALLVIFGLFYVVKFRPSKAESLTGKVAQGGTARARVGEPVSGPGRKA